MLYIGPGICDPDHKGFDAHGVLRRFGYVGSGVIYGVLAFAAASPSPARKDTSDDALALAAMAYQPPLG